jgi:hypothetical protein
MFNEVRQALYLFFFGVLVNLCREEYLETGPNIVHRKCF